MTYTYTQAIMPNEVQPMVMGDGQPTAYYGYDVHGDTTAITDGAKLNTHVIYDSQARPVGITTLDYRTPLTVTLSYNPAGQRASYHVVEPGQTPLDERFTYRAGLLGQMQLVQGSLAYTDTYLYTQAGAPYELLRQQGSATNRYWYEVDGRGNVVALTDSNGKVVDRYAYDSWGELTSDDGVNETVPQQLRYAGYWYDEKLSWYWLRVRYYDPEIARFLAPDPSQIDGLRTYAYVGDDPIDSTDPSGNSSAGVNVVADGVSGGSPLDDLAQGVGLFVAGAGALIAVTSKAVNLAGAGIRAGDLIFINGVHYIVNRIQVGNPAVIAVSCPAPAYGSIQSSGVGGGGTTVSSGACTAATVAPIYYMSENSGSGSAGNGSSDPSPPELDSTGRLHGAIPDYIPSSWTREQLEELAHDIPRSLRQREAEQQYFGEHDSHRRRQQQEQRLLRQVLKKLGGS